MAVDDEVSLDVPLLDCEEAAVLLKVRVSWVRDAARMGRLPCFRVGRHLRFSRVMLEEWLADQFERPPGTGSVRAQTRGSRAGSAVFRRGTQAALLAALEPPRREGGGRDE